MVRTLEDVLRVETLQLELVDARASLDLAEVGSEEHDYWASIEQWIEDEIHRMEER